MVDLFGSDGTWFLGTSLIAMGLYDTFVLSGNNKLPISDIFMLATGTILVHESEKGSTIVNAITNTIERTVMIRGM